MGVYNRSFSGGQRGSHALRGNMADMEGKGSFLTIGLAEFSRLGPALLARRTWAGGRRRSPSSPLAPAAPWVRSLPGLLPALPFGLGSTAEGENAGGPRHELAPGGPGPSLMAQPSWGPDHHRKATAMPAAQQWQEPCCICSPGSPDTAVSATGRGEERMVRMGGEEKGSGVRA